MNNARFVVISGGNGGLGRAAVSAFAARGYTVFSLDINKSETQMENVVEIETDVTDSESVSRAFDIVRCKTDRISAIISLAGTYFMDSLIEVPEAELEHIFKVNVFGVYHLNRIFLPLVRAGNGRILVTTSELAGMKALPFNGIYSLTKTALEHYTDSLRQELALLGVPVIEIKPGAFDTGMIAASFSSLDRMAEKTKLYRADAARFRRIMQIQSGTAKPPEKLAEILCHAVESKHPRLCYKPNNNLLLKLFNLCPRRLQVALIKRLIKN